VLPRSILACCFLVALWPALAAAQTEPCGWVERTTWPNFRGGLLTYDSARGHTLMIGASFTLAWDGTSWSPPMGQPPADLRVAMAFDSNRGVAVLFCQDRSGPGCTARTWEWDGQTWTLRATDGPSPRMYAAMAYDSQRDVTVLFGGVNEADVCGSTATNDTWEWDGDDWIVAATEGPSARRSPAMAYDSARGVTVLYGGSDAAGLGKDETWEWDGATWTQRFIEGPGPQSRHVMAYDAARQVTVLFDGGEFGGTWEYDGSEWLLRTTVGPGRRYYTTIAYDAGRGLCVLYGGGGRNDTWEWDGNAWTKRLDGDPWVHDDQAMVYDAAAQKVLLVTDAGSVIWERDAVQWSRREADGPPWRAGYAVAYDSARNRTVLFGGYDFFDDEYTWFGDTWEWDGENWTLVSETGPPCRTNHVMAYDSARQVRNRA